MLRTDDLRHCTFSAPVLGWLLATALVVGVPARTFAEVRPFLAAFKAREMAVTGGTLYVRVGGSGPAVLLLHGFGDTGDMWQPLAEILVKGHTVIVPDLRGMGLSSHPEGGYEKTSQARDIAKILDELKAHTFSLVTHDIGNMVGYALAALFPNRVERWAVMDAPFPGLGTWEQQLLNPRVWHFNFRGPDVERLVAGRERILLDRFYNELSATPAGIDEQTRRHYAALCARPGAIHKRPRWPVCRLLEGCRGEQGAVCKGGETPHASLGDRRRPFLRCRDEERGRSGRDERPGAVITNSGHWIMEEQPQQAIKAITAFLQKEQ